MHLELGCRICSNMVKTLHCKVIFAQPQYAAEHYVLNIPTAITRNMIIIPTLKRILQTQLILIISPIPVKGGCINQSFNLAILINMVSRRKIYCWLNWLRRKNFRNSVQIIAKLIPFRFFRLQIVINWYYIVRYCQPVLLARSSRRTMPTIRLSRLALNQAKIENPSEQWLSYWTIKQTSTSLTYFIVDGSVTNVLLGGKASSTLSSRTFGLHMQCISQDLATKQTSSSLCNIFCI